MLLVAMACASPRAATTAKWRIMTYNVPMGNILVTDGNGRNTWENRCAQLHAYLQDVSPDLLGMQEPVRNELCDVLKGIPGYAMVGFARDNGAEKGEYTPIIYKTRRFRVEASGNYWLTDTPDVVSKVEGSTHNRIATWALLVDKLTGARLLYTNTHLSYNSEAVKLAQIKVLKQHMKELNDKYGSTLPHLLTGDFNMQDTEDNYNYVLNWKIRMKDIWETTSDRWHWLTGKNTLQGRIDYIYATTNVKGVMVRWDNRKTDDGYWVSDHDPLWADVSYRITTEDEARKAMDDAWTAIDSTRTFTAGRIKLASSPTRMASDGMEPSYPLSYAIDSNTSTYAHSLYSTLPPNAPHYIQVRPNKEVTDVYFTFTRRRDNDEYGLSDRWEDVMVTASDDGERWDYIAELHDFGGTQNKSYSSENIALRKPYSYIRFNVMRTPGMKLRNGHPQFSVAEFHVYENKLAADCEYSSLPAVTEAADALAALVTAVSEKVAAHTVESSDVDALRQGIEALQQARRTTSIAVPMDVPAQFPQPSYRLDGTRYTGGSGMVVTKNRKILR